MKIKSIFANKFDGNTVFNSLPKCLEKHTIIVPYQPIQLQRGAHRIVRKLKKQTTKLQKYPSIRRSIITYMT